MIVAIDCRMINASGVGVYLRGCLSWLLQEKYTEQPNLKEVKDLSFLLLGNAENLQLYSKNKNVRIMHCDTKPFSLKEIFLFPREITKQINDATIYFSPFFNIPGGIKIPIYSTIHDIIFFDISYLSSGISLEARKWFFRRAYKKSYAIFTVSQFSKSRIEHHLGKGKRIIVTHSAIQPVFLNYRSNVKNVQKKETIIFIGNLKKHKGLDYLLDAFYLAKNEKLPHKLIIIGSKENFRTADKSIMQKVKSISGDAVCFTGYISDEQLMEQISSAALLVQPSIYEGFCLPPLEAMVLGTHALISDIPVLREIYSGFPVTYFKAGSVIELKNKILSLLNGKVPIPVLNDELLSKYTFEKTSSIILREFASLAS